jgi:hypothetical protein
MDELLVSNFICDTPVVFSLNDYWVFEWAIIAPSYVRLFVEPLISFLLFRFSKEELSLIA